MSRFGAMRLPIVIAALTVAAAFPAAAHPSFAGDWVLDKTLSTGALPQSAELSITQDSHWFRMSKTSQTGRETGTAQSECRTDGRFHPLTGTHGGSISCKWEGSTLVSEEHWGADDQSRRTVRTSIDPDGTLIQDITTSGPGNPGASHLVWKRH